MHWTLALISPLEDAPWPATRGELVDYAIRIGAPRETIDMLESMRDEGALYEQVSDLWPDHPRRSDALPPDEA